MGVAGGTSQGGGPRVLPERWREESTQPLPGNKDYGYFWWLRPTGGITPAACRTDSAARAPPARGRPPGFRLRITALHGGSWRAQRRTDRGTGNDTISSTSCAPCCRGQRTREHDLALAWAPTALYGCSYGATTMNQAREWPRPRAGACRGHERREGAVRGVLRVVARR
jgi:hypothetical protein